MMTGIGNHIERFKKLLLRACGHQFTDERERALIKALNQRMRQRRITVAEHYHALLQSDREELQQLIDLLTVNETYFFREPEYLQLAVDHLIPELLGAGPGLKPPGASRPRPHGEPLRIFCAGCATGEEPYSLAMLLDQRYGAESRRLFSIAAADIDATAVAQARRGVYGPGSFRGPATAFRERYFTPRATDAWQLGEIRHQVHFAVLNLLADSYPPAFQRPDIVFYRNVSIYFPGQVQKEIFTRLADQLNENGYLFVGASETMHHNLGILHLTQRDALFFFRKHRLPPLAAPKLGKLGPDTNFRAANYARKLGPDPNSVLKRKLVSDPNFGKLGENWGRTPIFGRNWDLTQRKLERKLVSPNFVPAPGDRDQRDQAKETDLSNLFGEALSLARSRRPEQALELLERLLAADTACSRAYALKGGILAEMDCYTEARQQGRLALEHDPLCLEASLLLGISARHLGDDDEAGRRFRDALYVNRACWPAHFYLAEIAYTRGKIEPAKRGYQSTLEVLEKRACPPDKELFFPLSFSPNQLISVCRHKLSLLADQAATNY